MNDRLIVLLPAGISWSALMFMVAYRIYRRTGNASVVDAVWSFAMGGIGMLYALLGAGDPVRRILLAMMAGGWGLRLGMHLTHRIRSEPEDARYEALRAEWRSKGWDVHQRMARFYANQAVSVLLLSLPFLLTAQHAAPASPMWLVTAGGLWLLAWAGETAADTQLRRFRADPANRGRVCDVGLWGWSRHPNYFCEWLVWVAFALLAFDAPWGWLGLLAPAGMAYLLLHVTGVPLTEARMLASRGDTYRAYQARVSRFVPWPPKAGVPRP